MSTTLDTFRAMDLHIFSSSEASVLFSPETLQIFLLNATSRAVVADLRAGRDPQQIAIDHHVDESAIERLAARIVADVRAAGPVWKSNGPTPKPRVPLPKLVLMVNNFCNLKCTYCYEHPTVFSKPALVMTTEIADTALRKFYDAFGAVETLMFIGGEPTPTPEIA